MHDETQPQPPTAEPTPSRREALAALAVGGCCLTVGAGVAAAQPAPGDERVPAAAAAGRAEIAPVALFDKEGIYDDFARAKQVMIVRKGDTLHAMSSICTHKRCVLKHREGELILRCPCHQTQFDQDGVVLKPPAKVPLPHYAIEIAEGQVIVDTSKSFAEQDWSNPAANATIPGTPTTQPG